MAHHNYLSDEVSVELLFLLDQLDQVLLFTTVSCDSDLRLPRMKNLPQQWNWAITPLYFLI